MHNHCHKMPHTISYDEYFNISNNILICDHHKHCEHKSCHHHDDLFVYPHVPCEHKPIHPHIHDEHVHVHKEFPRRPLMDVDGDGFVEANFILKPF